MNNLNTFYNGVIRQLNEESETNTTIVNKFGSVNYLMSEYNDVYADPSKGNILDILEALATDARALSDAAQQEHNDRTDDEHESFMRDLNR